MIFAIEQNDPDVIIHLGDNIGDAVKIREKFPKQAFHMIKGNCDVNATGDVEKTITIDGIKIYMTHGHRYHVKEGLSYLMKHTQDSDINLTLFGHTHLATITEDKGATLMNPGQMRSHSNRQPASYGIVLISDSRFDCGITYLPDEVNISG